jgi:23S rRNA (uracil1939-C5)-methyltransferase
MADGCDLARIANHGQALLTRRAPRLTIGRATVTPPPGGFLQATLAGETTIAKLVLDAAKGANHVADLYSGIGTFALRLAEAADVAAFESDARAVAALLAAARAASGLRNVEATPRDLARRPLTREDLRPFDCVVFDPPRAGAAEQAAILAASTVPRIVGVSCNAQTFARDARLLVDGGYRLEQVTPVDQFRHSAHVELVGVFTRPKAPKKKRSLLSG